MINYNPHEWRSHLFDIRGSMLPEIIGRVNSFLGFNAISRIRHTLTPRNWARTGLSRIMRKV